MAKSLIKRNQLDPDIIDLISGYTNEVFVNKVEFGEYLEDISGQFVKKFGNENITGIKNFITKPTVNNIPVLVSGDIIGGGGSTVFNGQRPITANVIGFKNLNPNTTDVVNFLDKIFYPFISATGSLNSVSIREFGLDSNILNIAGTITANNETHISSITYQTGFNNVYQTVNTETYQNIKNIFNFSNSTIIFKTTNLRVLLQFPNINGSPSPLIITDTKTSTYEAPYFYGVSNQSSLNSFQVTTLLTKGPILQTPSRVTHNFSPVNQYMYIAIPNDNNFNLTPWNPISSVKDENTNYDYTSDLNPPQSLSVTIGGGRLINYRVYRWKNLVNGGIYKLQFNF